MPSSRHLRAVPPISVSRRPCSASCVAIHPPRGHARCLRRIDTRLSEAVQLRSSRVYVDTEGVAVLHSSRLLVASPAPLSAGSRKSPQGSCRPSVACSFTVPSHQEDSALSICNTVVLPRPRKTPSTSSRNVSGDLVQGGTGDLIGINLRSPLNNLPKSLQQSWIGISAVSIRVLFLMPQADHYGFRGVERHAAIRNGRPYRNTRPV